MSAFCSQTCVQPPCHPSLAAPSCGDLTVSTWYDSHLNLYEVEVGLDDAGAVEPVCHTLTLVAEDGGILVSKVFSGEDVVFIATPQNKLLECGTPFYAQAVVCEAVGCTAADLRCSPLWSCRAPPVRARTRPRRRRRRHAIAAPPPPPPPPRRRRPAPPTLPPPASPPAPPPPLLPSPSPPPPHRRQRGPRQHRRCHRHRRRHRRPPRPPPAPPQPAAPTPVLPPPSAPPAAVAVGAPPQPPLPARPSPQPPPPEPPPPPPAPAPGAVFRLPADVASSTALLNRSLVDGISRVAPHDTG